MSTDSPQSVSEPQNAVSHALETVANALRDGASEATTRVRNGMPGAGRFMSRVVYSGCYFLSYGVVFPTVFAANFVPGMGSIRDGLMDGAKAANDCVAELRYKKCAESAASPEACSTSDCSTTGASCEMPATS